MSNSEDDGLGGGGPVVDAGSWIGAAFLVAIVAALLIGFALFVRWAVMESDAKHQCRSSGRVVTKTTDGDDWYCATPEPGCRP